MTDPRSNHHHGAISAALAEEAEESGDPSILEDDDDLDEEEEPLPLPIPKAVEIILTIAVGDERGEYKDANGDPLLEEVSTIVPILCSEILRVEDPVEAAEEGL